MPPAGVRHPSGGGCKPWQRSVDPTNPNRIARSGLSFIILNWPHGCPRGHRRRSGADLSRLLLALVGTGVAVVRSTETDSVSFHAFVDPLPLADNSSVTNLGISTPPGPLAADFSTDEIIDSMAEVWHDVPANLRPAAAVVMEAHLAKLESEGRLPPGLGE